MCFHNSMSKKAKELASRYGRKSDIVEIYQDIINENYHVSAFTNPDYPIITNDEEIQVMKWGLIPFWTKDELYAENVRKMTYNARSETLYQKPSFREPIKQHRCIVPSTGYFEWRHEGDKKIPYYIYLKHEPIFSMAGIYDIWEDKKTGEVLHTFSIITTQANKLTGYIHNGGNNSQRMPAILLEKDENKWMDPKLSKDEIEDLLLPIDEHFMDAYIIKNDFLKKNPKDDSILERV